MPKILLVKTTSLGDVIHNLPVVTDLANRVPDADIHWLVEDSFAAIPALHPAVSRIIKVATRRWRKKLFLPSTWFELRAFLRDLKSEKYDYVIDTQGLLKSAFMARRARGPVYGQNRESAREPTACRFYDHTYFVDRAQHAVQRNRQLAAKVFKYDLANSPLDYGISANGQEANLKWLPSNRYVVFLHGTSRDSKLWPMENWIELGHRLVDEGFDIVLPWGNEIEHARSTLMSQSIDRAIVTPKIGLDGLAVVLNGATGAVGVDTGPTHLAVALNSPTVAIYTDTDPALTGVLPMDPKRAINIGNRGQVPAVDLANESLNQVLGHE
jgi:heptosyltransferase-1